MTASPYLSIGLTMIGVALVELLIAMVFALKTRSFISRAVRVPGVVVEYRGQIPVVEYTDSYGQTHQHVSFARKSPPSFKVGDSVDIFYLEKTPEKSRMNWFMELWFVPTLMIGMSILFVILGVIFMIVGNF